MRAWPGLPCLLASLLAVSASAQGAPRAVPLNEALAMARQQSAPVLLADLAVDDALAERRRVSALQWPTLDVFTGSALNYGLTFDQTVGAVTRDAVRSGDVALQTEYTLFDGYERRALSQVADQSLRVAELGQAVARREAVLEVLVLYFSIARAEASLAIAGANLQAQRALLSRTESQVDVGTRAEYELAQQRERVASARGDSLALVQEQELATSRLVRLLRLDPMETYLFTVQGVENSLASVPVESDSVLIAQAWETRADIRAADSRVEAARAGERVAASARYPTLSVLGVVGSTYSSANAVGFFDQVGKNQAMAVGLRLRVPLFDRGSTRSLRAQARLGTERRRLEADEVRRSVAFEVREVRADLRRVGARLTASQARVVAAQTAFDAEVARYETGLTTVQAVSLVRARLIEALTEKAQLELALQFGEVRLRFVAGLEGGAGV